MKSGILRSLPTAICLLSVNTLAYSADPLVVGDALLLRQLIDVQETNQSLFTRGRMEAEFEDNTSRVKMTAVWDGDKYYWNYNLTWFKLKPKPGETKPRVSSKVGERIYTPGKMVGLWRDKITYARKSTGGTRSENVERQLEVFPQDWWYKLEGKLLWTEIIDPKHAHKFVTKYIVERKDNDRVVVKRDHTFGGVMTVEFSLKHGGNIVRYQFDAPDVGSEMGTAFWRMGEYEWKPTDDQWYLARYSWQSSSKGDPDKVDKRGQLIVSEFDPNPDIPDDRFEFSSLTAPKGTLLQQRKGKKSLKTVRLGAGGEEGKRVSTSRLDDLAGKAGKRGFGAKQPDKDDE